MFVCVNNWIHADNVQEAYTTRRCLKLVVESIESNHIAKKIFNYSFLDGDIQRFNPNSFNELLPLMDDFEVHFFNDMTNIIRNNLELFGFTGSVVLYPRLINIPQGAEYENARGGGIIAVNDVTNQTQVIHMQRQELSDLLSRKSLRTRIHQLREENIVTTLPIYVAYREAQNYVWKKEDEAFEILVPQGEFVYGKDESLIPGTFLRQFMLPAARGPAFPDQYFISSPFLSFWYSGNVALTFTATPEQIIGGFKWMSDLQNFNVLNVPDDADTDLEIPHELHDKFSDLPPCPEHTKPPGSKNFKLLATLYDKKEYVIHYRNLKQALALGGRLVKIHRVLSFKQSAWLKAHIDLNTVLRQNAKNHFDKNLFKLVVNSTFGKTMQNIRKHSTVKLITRWGGRYGAEALIFRPEFKSSVIINNNLVIIEMAKSELFFDKPIYVEMSILDIAKTTLYDFHYNYMKTTFSDCTAIYTDTDSLIYEIKNQGVYEIMKRDCQQRFDTSDYSSDNRYNIPRVNKKVMGMMKDENNGRIMSHFIGLRSKMYATKQVFTSEELEQRENELRRKGEERKEIDTYFRNLGVTKIKGVKKCVIKKTITFDDYVQCLETFNEKTITQKLIRSSKHELFSTEQSKIGLSASDDKRHLIKGSVQTLPHGHSIMDM